MADQSIACPSCGTKIPLTEALRAEIEASVRDDYARRHEAELERVRLRAAQDAAQKAAAERALLEADLKAQAEALQQAREMELALRHRERELEREREDLEIAIARRIDDERKQIAGEAEARAVEQHRLKDAEKERQLADMRRQIEDLKRRAEQGSQQAQGEAGEAELEAGLRAAFPWDEITPVAQGVRGADLHQVVSDPRGGRCGAILWECKNAKHWSDAWIGKLKDDQRALRADLAVLVTSSLPKGCARLAVVEGVVVCDFTSATAVAAILRAQLAQVALVRRAAVNKGETLELLHRYLSGVEFRQRVEAVVEAFERMREDLEQERRAAERQWAKRAKQIDAVTCNVAGMYGDLQGLLPALPPIARLELPEPDDVALSA